MNKSQLNELNVPKLRFKGFEEEWQKKQLTEVCNLFSGITYSKESENRHGQYTVLRANNIYQFKLNLNNLLKINLSKKPNEKFFIKDKDILICSNSGSKNLLGKSCVINSKFHDFLIGGFMLVAREYQPIIPYFFNSKMWFDEININTSGTINSINKGILNKISLFLPSFLEQEKIAHFFSLLDKQIELYETKLQLNEQIELYFLDQLFRKHKLESSINDLVIRTSNINKKSIEYRNGCISKLKGVTFQNSFFKNEIKSKNLTSHKILYENEYIYNPARINIGSIARNKTQETLLFSPMYDSFKLKDIQNIDMFDIFFKSNMFISRCKQLAFGSVRNTLSWDDFSSIKIFNPKNLKYDYIKLLKKLKYNTEYIRKNIWNLNIKKKFYIKKMFI